MKTHEKSSQHRKPAQSVIELEAKVMALMDDKRERTEDDIMLALGLKRDATREVTSRLSRVGLLSRIRVVENLSIWVAAT